MRHVPDPTQPSIAVLMPVFHPPLEFLRAAMDSVRQQTTADWQLVVVDDGNADPELASRLARAAEDPRVTVVTLERNTGIAGALNAGLERVGAPWVALLDQDDLLEPAALSRVLTAASANPTAELIYTDRDAVDASAAPTEVFLKPQWSPRRLEANMYVAHLTVLSTAVVRALGGFRPEFDGAQDHDLVLRVTERGGPVVHVPEVLYHWRQHPGSTAADPGAKPAAADAGLRAVQEHLDRTDPGSLARHSAHAGTYLVDRCPRPALASIIIPTRGGSSKVRGRRVCLVVEALRSIVAHDYETDYEVVLVHDEDADGHYLEEASALLGDRIRVVPFEGPFNFSAKVNCGVKAARGDVVVLLNDDVEVISGRWLDQLVALAQHDDVGAVGAKLLFEDGQVQHAGHFFVGGQVQHVAHGRREDAGPFAANVIDREVVGVTAACLAQRREVWERVGGMDETLPNNFNDVDYCNRIRAHGWRIVQANSVRLFHFESRTRQARVASWEAQRIIGRLGDQLRIRDPFTPVERSGRSAGEWFSHGRAVLEQEGWAGFTAKVRARLAKSSG